MGLFELVRMHELGWVRVQAGWFECGVVTGEGAARDLVSTAAAVHVGAAATTYNL